MVQGCSGTHRKGCRASQLKLQMPAPKTNSVWQTKVFTISAKVAGSIFGPYFLSLIDRYIFIHWCLLLNHHFWHSCVPLSAFSAPRSSSLRLNPLIAPACTPKSPSYPNQKVPVFFPRLSSLVPFNSCNLGLTFPSPSCYTRHLWHGPNVCQQTRR